MPTRAEPRASGSPFTVIPDRSSKMLFDSKMRVSLVFVALSVAWVAGCTWHGVPYSYSAYQAGKSEANQYLRDKGIAAMNVGEPFGENKAEMQLKTQYGIPTVLIATGMPTDQDIGRLKGFNETMGNASRAKYGKDVINEAFQR